MMQRGVALALAITLTMLIIGCGDTKVINGIEYDMYGILNEDDKKNPDIQYEIIWGNVFWGVVLIETVIAPIYFFGYSLFEPVGVKSEIKGQIVR